MAGFECVATGRSIERLLNASFHDTTHFPQRESVDGVPRGWSVTR
jgi:hypothetical protein